MSAAVKLNLKPLRSLMVKVGELEGRRVKVGLLASTAGRVADGGRLDHNPSLGAVHEFGLAFSVVSTGTTCTIPQRSFLHMPLTMHLHETLKDASSDFVHRLMKGQSGVVGVLKMLARAAELTIDKAFVTSGWGSWPALQPETVRRKKYLGRSLKILQETQQLRRAITSEVL